MIRTLVGEGMELKEMRAIAIIQARMGSTRLPGKVMKKLGDKTVLEHVIRRVSNVPELDGVVVATTTLEMDDVIAQEAQTCGAKVYRGEEHDVLGRFYGAAINEQADVIVRITSDCPFIDSGIISRLLQIYQSRQYDYVSNTLERSFPRGLDAEVFSFESLEMAYQFAHESSLREHVTPYIYMNKDRFALYSYTHETDCSRYRWTLDTDEDWQLIEKMYSCLYDPEAIFKWQDALNLMNLQPELAKINEHVEQKKVQVD